MKLEFDTERMKKLISSIRQSVGLLQEIAELPEKVFVKDVHKQCSAKYNFIASIEAVIDLANHLISRNKLRAPEDYADTFAVLAESKIIKSNFSEELMKMARFRNRLVHLYWDIDVKELYNILQTKLNDFDNFLKSISKHITL